MPKDTLSVSAARSHENEVSMIHNIFTVRRLMAIAFSAAAFAAAPVHADTVTVMIRR